MQSKTTIPRISAVVLMLLAACILSAAALPQHVAAETLNATALRDHKYAFPKNGWTYYPTGDLSRYSSLSSIKDIHYDSEGRIVSFEGHWDNGANSVETFSYEGNKVYNQNGDFLGLIYSGNSSPGDQAVAKEETKSQSRTLVRLIKGRIATLQAPRPATTPSQAKVGLKRRLKSENTIAMVSGDSSESTELAYKVDKTLVDGLAAGDAAADKLGLGVWLTGGFSLIGNTKDESEFDGYTGMALVGVDYRLTDRTLVGVGFGMEGAYVEENFYNLEGKSGSIGYVIAPYLSVALFEQTIFDLITGFSFLSNGSTSDAYHDSFRYMVSPNLTQYFVLDQWLLSASMGYTYTRETGYHYTNSDNAPFFDLPEADFAASNSQPDPVQTGELRIGGRASYSLEYLMPFLDVAYIYDTIEKEEDPDEIEVTMGLDFYPTDSFIISVEAANSFFRDDTYNARFMMNLRYEF